jgi:hypothetical protein
VPIGQGVVSRIRTSRTVRNDRVEGLGVSSPGIHGSIVGRKNRGGTSYPLASIFLAFH